MKRIGYTVTLTHSLVFHKTCYNIDLSLPKHLWKVNILFVFSLSTMDLVHILGSGVLANGRILVLTNYRKWAVKIPTTFIVNIYTNSYSSIIKYMPNPENLPVVPLACYSGEINWITRNLMLDSWLGMEWSKICIRPKMFFDSISHRL